MPSYCTILEKLGIRAKFFDVLLNIVNWNSPPHKDLRSMRRFLFLQYDRALGQAINVIPLFEELKRAIPDAHIAIVTSGLSYDIFKACPYIDEVYNTPHPIGQFPKVLGYFLRHMRRWRKSYDCVMTDSVNYNNKVALLQIASGVPVRAGYTARSTWAHYPLAVSDHVTKKTSVIEHNLKVLDLLGLPYQIKEPRLFINQWDAQAGENILENLEMPENGPLILIATQGSGRQPIAWFDDRFAALGNRLFDRYGARLVFVGSAEHVGAIEKIRKQMRVPSYNLAGKTTVPQLAAIACMSDLMLTVDTGVLHLGRAVQVPMVILASAYQEAELWLPLGMDRYLILRRDHVPCALCWKSVCATRECMEEISVDDVMEGVETQFRRFPPSAEQQQFRLESALTERYGSHPELAAKEAVPEPR